MDNKESIGVVSAHYFVGRGALLQWINDLTQLNYTKIEQTASGVFVCHVFDALYPGQIRLEKVKFNARQEYEFIHNYKILQACFNRVGMKRQIDVQKLIRGKYQDNLEFIQWVKAYYDSHASERALQYNGRARREEVAARNPSPRAALADLPANPPRTGVKHSAPSENPPTQTSVRPRPPLYGASKAAQTSVGIGRAQMTQLKQDLDLLKEESENQKTLIADLETEKAFYFNKLRKIELIIQAVGDIKSEDEPKVLNILRDGYAEIKEALYAEEDEVLDSVVEGAPYEDAVDGEELVQDPQYQDGEDLDDAYEDYKHESVLVGK